MSDAPSDLTYEVPDPYPSDDRPDRERAGQTIPTLFGVQAAYRDLEREMFSHPEDAERYAEILSLTRQQLRDHRLGDNVDSQMIGYGNRVTPIDPDEVQRLMVLGVATKVPREKTARMVAEDDLLRAGLAPILAGLPIPQLDAIRHVHWFQMSERDAADKLGIIRPSLQSRLKRAYASIRAAIPVEGYRKVRAWLVAQGQKDRARREEVNVR